MRGVVVIGGGFSGVAVGVNLAAASREPLAITVVEPAESVGRGVAYGTDDPDHRLNGPSVIHFLQLADTAHFTRWHAECGALERDPESVHGNVVFARRHDFGTYLNEQFEVAAASNPSGSVITHRRDRVVDIDVSARGVRVKLHQHDPIDADLAVLTTSNAPPAVPPALRPLNGASGFIGNPWEPAALAAVPPAGRVLIVGTGLTMADVAVTIRRDRPDVAVSSFSRRGLMPRSLPAEFGGPRGDIIDILTTRSPAFLDRHRDATTVRDLLRRVRADIAAAVADGGSWHGGFDAVRDAAHVVWPNLAPAEQARFVRHLAPWYEVHRFRFPPQTERVIAAALADGSLTVEASRLIAARVRDDGFEIVRRRRRDGVEVAETFDVVVNCTGPERKPRASGDPLLANLVARGVVTPDRNGLGLSVDDLSSAVDASGESNPRLRVVGPLARGRFGECAGVPHIVARMSDALPSMLDTIRDAECLNLVSD